MSSHAQESASIDEEDVMNIEGPGHVAPVRSPSGSSNNNNSQHQDHNHEYEHLATVVRDATGWLSHIKSLQETDVIILLTPVVMPVSQDSSGISDPFEPFGRALARRHARIRQVPYTQRNGITSTHLGFIKRGHVIILCFTLRPSQPLQLDFADIAFAVSDNKPCIIVVCCGDVQNSPPVPFPTLIQIQGYSPPALEATAALIFGEYQSQMTEQEPPRKASSISQLPHTRSQTPQTPQAMIWPVSEWDEARDLASVLDLWTKNMSARFSVDEQTFASLLRRPGYAKHYVVRDAGTQAILGFCGTYLSYVDQEGEKLIASLAILLVRSDKRNQGVGSSLHSHAMDQLRKTRGVVRLQLGSTFPRILYGPPLDMSVNEDWFERRGWQLNNHLPGQGQAIHDLVLDFERWQEIGSTTVTYRLCTQDDMVEVLAMVEYVSTMQGKMGWFDQYSSLMNGPNVKDVILGIEHDKIIATALTYTPSCGSQIAMNLPWASRIGHDVGGVTCLCIPPPNQAATLVGLLDSSIKYLKTQGVKRMFIDGVSGAFIDLKNLGFEEWARYKDVWKDM